MTNEDKYSIIVRPSVHRLMASWLSPSELPEVWAEVTIEGEKHIPGMRQVAPGRWCLRVYVRWLGRNKYMDEVWFMGDGQSTMDSQTHGRRTLVLGKLDLRHENESWLIVPDELCRSIPDESKGGSVSPQARALDNAFQLSKEFGLGLLGEYMAREVIIDTITPAAKAAK